RRYRPWPCYHPQARTHDGRRRDGDERAGQRLGVHGAAAGRLNSMNLPRGRFLHLAAGAAALPALSRVASAQTYPTRPVRLILGYAPGNAPDIVARLIGEWLAIERGDNAGRQRKPRTVVSSLHHLTPVIICLVKVARTADSLLGNLLVNVG